MAADLNKLTVAQLKEQLSEKGLDTTGKKSDLVERLEANSNDEETPDNLISEGDDVTGNGEGESNGDAGNGEGESNGDADEETMETEQTEEDKGEEEEETEAADGDKEEEDEGDDHKEEADEKEEAMEEGDDKGGDDEEKKEKEEEKLPPGKGIIIALDDNTKIVIPTKEYVRQDLRQYARVKTVLVHPVTVEEVTSPLFKEYLSKCVHFQIIFQDNIHEKTKTENGYIEFRFSTSEEAEAAVEELSQLKEGLEVVHMAAPDVKVDFVKDAHQEALLKRYLYIGNLPAIATEQALETVFSEATRIALIHNEEGEFKGYALAEMESEEAVDKACESYKEVEFEGKHLIVIKMWAKNPKGLLDHTTRVDLLKQVRRLRMRINALNRGGRFRDPMQVRRMESEMSLLKQRLDKDCQTRRENGLPSPPDVVRREKILAEQEEEKKKVTEKGDGAEKDEKKDKPTPKRAFQQKTGGRWRPPPSRRGEYSNRGFGQRGSYSSGGYDNRSQQAQPQNLDQALGLLQNLSQMIGGIQTVGNQTGGTARSFGNYGDRYGSGASQASIGGGYSDGYGYGSQNYGGTGYGTSGGYGNQRGDKRRLSGEGYGGGAKKGPGAGGRGYGRKW